MSLGRCLKKLGLSKHESAIMRALTREQKGSGAEKAKAAVRQRLKDLRAEKTSIDAQVARAQEVGTGERDNPVQASTPEHIEAAAVRAAKNPTPAQIEAGVNRKGHFQFANEPLSGLGIVSIETAKGERRIAKLGEWSSPPLSAHYGHLQIAEGTDGDKADVTIGSDREAKNAYVIDQVKDDGSFDETKSFLWFPSEDAARKAYLASFSDDATKRIGAITEMPVEQFVRKAQANELAKPVAYEQPQFIEQTAEEKVSEVLDKAGVKGKDRLEVLSAYRKGEYTQADLEAAYPAMPQAQESETPSVATETPAAQETISPARSPEDQQPLLSRQPPTIETASLKLAHPRHWENGNGIDSYSYRAYDENRHFLGTISLGWRGDQVVKLHDIKAATDRKGFGRSIIRAILDNNAPDTEVHIANIRPESRGFWEKMGVQFFKTNEGEDGNLTRRSYTQANRRASGVSEGTGEEDGGPVVRRAGKTVARGVHEKVSTQPAALRTFIAGITENWKNSPKVEVLASMDDAPVEIRNHDEAMQSQGATGAVDGVHWRGTIYLVADRIPDNQRAVQILFHEALGHYGLRGTFGASLKPILKQVAAYRRSDVAAKAKAYGLDMNKEADRLLAAEEVLAEMAESNPQLSFVQRAIAAIRKFLKDIGVELELTNNDIVANYLAPAREFVRDSGQSKSEIPAFSRAPQSLPERINEARQQGYKGLATKAVNFVDEALNPLHTLPDQTQYLVDRYLAQGVIDSADQVAGGIRTTLAGASEADTQALYDYFTTAAGTPEAITDPTLRARAQEIKAQINRVGDELVEKGLLPAESREQYRDAYLPRLYLKHLLSEQDWKALGTGKKPSDMGYLKGRKDIPEDVRKVILGEVTDPGFLAGMAIAKPMRDMALLDWLGKISGNQNWIMPGGVVAYTSPLTGQELRVTPYWLQSEAARLRKQAIYLKTEDALKAQDEAKAMDQKATEALDDMPAQHTDYKQIPNTARYGRLRGLQVRQEIYNDLMGVNDFLPTDPGWFQNVFGYGGIGTKATQIWKGMKVAMNPPAQVRNFVSNAVALQLSGVPLRLVPARVIQAAREIANQGKYYQIAKKYGVSASTFSTQEVFRMKTELLDLEMKTRGLGPLGRMHRLAALLMNKAGDFYQFSETLFKTAKIIDAMERDGKSEQDAVLESQRWMFDYSLVQKSVRYARNAPIGIPFLTYQLKILPRLIEVAALHPQRFLPWVGLFVGFPMMTAAMLGVDKDDLDKLKKAMPQWLQEKGHALILPFKDDEGRWQVVDLGYFMPWSAWLQVGSQVTTGELGKAVQSAGIFGGPITDIIIAIKTGKDPFTGKDIFAKGDPPERQLAALINYMWGMAMPPIVTDRGLVSPMGILDSAYGGKLVQAITGETNKQGEPRATVEQALMYAAGLSTYGLTPEYSRQTNLQAMTRDMQDVKRQMGYKLQDRSLSEDRRREIATEYAEEILRRATKMQKYIQESKIAPALATQH